MTKRIETSEKEMLLRLADAFVEDILDSSDEEVFSEVNDLFGDPVNFANYMRGQIDLLAIAGNRGRLVAARQAMESERKNTRRITNIDLDQARKALANLFSRGVNSLPITVAARKEKVGEMSDDDVLGMVEDLKLLGLVIRSKSNTKKDDE